MCYNIYYKGGDLLRLKITTSKNAASLYVIKSIYNSKTQSNSSKVIEKLGTEKELREKVSGDEVVFGVLDVKRGKLFENKN